MAWMDVLLMVSVIAVTTLVHWAIGAPDKAGLVRRLFGRVGTFVIGCVFGVLLGLYLGVSLRGPADRSAELIFHVVAISIVFSAFGPVIGGRVWATLVRLTPAPRAPSAATPSPTKPAS